MFEVHVTRIDDGGSEGSPLRLHASELRSALNKASTFMMWYLEGDDPHHYHLLIEIKKYHSIIARIEL